MSFTRTTESGDYETTSETIGALINREWDTTNTNISSGGSPIPTIIFDEDAVNTVNITELMEAIVFRNVNTFAVEERTALGHGMIGMADQVLIDIYAATDKKRKLYEFEIHRILRKFRPIGNNAFTAIKKSNNSDNSPIHDYDEILPEFVAFDDDVKGRSRSNKSSAILTCLIEYQFS